MASNQLHRGVSLIQRPSGCYLRWVDPRSKKRTEKRLPDGLTKKQRTQAAIEQAAKVQQVKKRVATGEARAVDAGVDLVQEWIEDAAAPSTKNNRRRTARYLYELKDSMGRRGWDEIILDDLIRLRRIIASDSKIGGRTKNLHLVQSRGFLTRLRRLGHRLFVEDSTVSDCFVRFKEEPAKVGELLDPTELQELFIRLHDDDAEVGLFALLLFLTGLRLNELVSVKGADFVFSANRSPCIQVHASKTNKVRTVSLKASPLATKILYCLKTLRGDGYLLRPNDNRTTAERYHAFQQPLLRRFKVMPKSLRVCNATYLARTPSFQGDIFALAENLGHSVIVQQNHYRKHSNILDLPVLPTIEEVAGLEIIGEGLIRKTNIEEAFPNGVDEALKVMREQRTKDDARMFIRSVVARDEGALDNLRSEVQKRKERRNKRSHR